jgi:HAD superfamily hydrolase (TIGR01549 family)
MNKPLTEYQTLVFDCDGVVLNSNKIKTQAFYDVAKVYGHEPAQALKDYHVQNGGISRFVKFEYLLTEILKKPLDQTELKQMLDSFAHEVKKALMTCEVAEGLAELREQTKHANWLIVSGGDQEELREVFKARDLNHYFNGGIFGSPDTKNTILAREIANGNIRQAALFLGDSKYDYQAAKKAGLDFVFMSQWTEVEDWQRWCAGYGLCVHFNLQDPRIHTISAIAL